MDDTFRYLSLEDTETQIKMEEENLRSIRNNFNIITNKLAQNPNNTTFIYEEANLQRTLKKLQDRLQALEVRKAKLSATPPQPISTSPIEVLSPKTQQPTPDTNNMPGNQPALIPPPRAPDNEPTIPANVTGVRGTGHHRAVVAGISTYEEGTSYSPLKTCAKDAEDLYELLALHSFHPSDIRLFTDHTLTYPSNEKILACLQTTARATGPDDVLFFYYSGLVDEDDQDGYLIASNSLRQELQRTALPLQQIKSMLCNAPARATIIMLDISHARARSPADNEQLIETFIHRISEQNGGVIMLSAAKKPDSDATQSLFISLLREAFLHNDTHQFKGVVTVQEICQELKKHMKLFLSLPNDAARETVFYRHNNRTSDRYLTSMYAYVVKAYRVLEDILKNMQTMLATGRATVYESTCKRLLKVLSTIDDPPPSESTYFSRQEVLLNNRVYKIHDFLARLRNKITEMRVMCQCSTAKASTMYQATFAYLTKFKPELYQIERELRNDLLPGENNG